MRASLLAIALIVLPSFAYAQSESCAQLRRACEMKNSLGETGQGNCRAYRERCGRGGEINRIRPNCQQLRAACMYKNETGQVGQGNCQRYRESCQ